MLIKKTNSHTLKEHQVTDEAVYQDRRRLLKSMGFIGASGLLANQANAGVLDFFSKEDVEPFKVSPLKFKSSEVTTDLLTPEAKVTSHNNFYEFGSKKHQPAELSTEF